jgi:hypothetical protein
MVCYDFHETHVLDFHDSSLDAHISLVELPSNIVFDISRKLMQSSLNDVEANLWIQFKFAK